MYESAYSPLHYNNYYKLLLIIIKTFRAILLKSDICIPPQNRAWLEPS